MAPLAKKVRKVALEASGGALFSLPTGVPKANFVMSRSLGEADEWLAKILVGNSLPSQGNLRVGSMDGVGYVMVSTLNNWIIPIARSDEHHTGYDVLEEVYAEKYGVDPNRFTSLYALGNNYVHEDEIPQFIEACKRFLSYGGRDLPVHLVGAYNRPVLSMSKLIEFGEFPETFEGTGRTAPVGEEIIAAVDRASKALIRYRRTMSHATERAFYDSVRSLGRVLEDRILGSFAFSILEPEYFKKWRSEVDDAIVAEDFEAVEEAVFAFGGIKNEIHNNLRKLAGNKKEFDYNKAVSLFGDLNQAVELLGKF